MIYYALALLITCLAIIRLWPKVQTTCQGLPVPNSMLSMCPRCRRVYSRQRARPFCPGRFGNV